MPVLKRTGNPRPISRLKMGQPKQAARAIVPCPALARVYVAASSGTVSPHDRIVPPIMSCNVYAMSLVTVLGIGVRPPVPRTTRHQEMWAQN